MEKNYLLKEGELKIIEGNSHEFVSSLAVQLVGSEDMCAIILDGSSTINPYFMVKESKNRGFKKEKVLDRIYVARAFTAYQFRDLVKKTEQKIKNENKVDFLGMIGISPLFEDKELEEEEGRWIRSKLMRDIKRTVKEKSIYSVLADPDADAFK